MALACFDYGLQSKTDEDPVGLDTAPFAVEDVSPNIPGECDSMDLPSAVQKDESCIIEPVTGDLQASVEWEVTAFDNYTSNREVLMTPVVGDLSGDGIPDILIVTHADQDTSDKRNGVMRLLSGDGAGQHWARQRLDYELDGAELQVYPYRYTNAALGDIDADGEPEVVAIALVRGGAGGGEEPDPGGEDSEPPDSGAGGQDSQPGEDTSEPQVDPNPPMEDATRCRVAAWSDRGKLEWVSGQDIECGGHSPGIADLDGDGEPEVVVGALILSGSDGSLIGQGELGQGSASAYPDMGWHSAVADLDGDGRQEVIAGNTVYGPDATPICETGGTDGFVAVADTDLDGRGELVVTGNGRVEVYNDDCTPASAWSLAGGGNGGPATLADFDADGQVEIGVADQTTYTVYESDGTVIWSQPVQDESSHATGSAVFDFEGDGHPEVVYADETTLWVFDGATGVVRLKDGRHESRTLHELPTVVDVDGDGHAEIVVPNGGSHHEVSNWGLYVLGATDDSWVGGSSVWNQHAFSITNVNPDLSIPSSPQQNWPTHNNFRSGDLVTPEGGALPDAVLLAQGCALECLMDRNVLVAGIGNSGMGTLGVATLVVRDDDGVELARMDLPEPLQPGAVSEPLRVTLPTEATRVHLSVEGVALDCDPSDNTLSLVLGCP